MPCSRSALLRRSVGAVGLAASLMVGVAAPLSFVLGEGRDTGEAAEDDGARLARVAKTHPDTRASQRAGLAEALAAARPEGGRAADETRRVYDASGRPVVADGPPSAGPTVTRSAPNRASEPAVGRVDVTASLWPLAAEGGFVALLGAGLGLLAFFAARAAPQRILDNTLDELEGTTRTLRAQNLRFDAAIEGMAHGLCMFGPDERMIVCNGHYLRMFGLSRAVVVPGVSLRDILGHSVAVGIASKEAEALYAERKAFVDRREPATYHETLSDGRAVAISHRPMADGGWVAIYEDVTDQLRAVEGVREQNRRFDAALANMGQGLLMFDAEARLLVRNQRFLDLLGLDELDVYPGQGHEEVIGRMIAAGPYAGLDVETVLDGFRRRLASGDTGPFFREFADGRVVAVAHRPMAGGGWVTTFEDVTEQRRSEARIAHMARHDGLTGLPNRAALRDHLLRVLEAAERGGPPVSVLCLDLDRFKSVNDTLGHAVGDALLKAVAERLLAAVAAVGQSRGALVARLGGDEFAIALSAETADPDDARALPDALARRLIKALSAPFDLHGHRVLVGTSVGVALAPAHGNDPEQLLCNADLALCRAKAEARGTCRVFEPEMDARMQKRRALELDLRQALARGEFELHYQPVLHLDSMRVASVEALLRWHHPERGLISPSEFIPIAEEIGLVAPIDDWVLRQACLDAAGWRRLVKVAVNLSPAQFKGRDLSGGVVRALAASGLSASRLELEITESVLLMENEATLDTLHRLRSFGVRIALDDFGVGYSSLSYLRAFPFDRIKIDRSFVRELGVKSDCLAIVRAVTGLAADLGMESTAEGVETADQLARVRAEGVTHVQGFLFSRPLPAREVDALLAGLEPAGARAA